MQYAKVIIDQPLSKHEYLIYAIPADILAEVLIGQLVEVPFKSTKKIGLVIGFTPRLPKPMKVSPISSIISTGSIVSHNHIRLYKHIATHFAALLSDVIFYFVPPSLKHLPIMITDSQTRKRGTYHIYYGTTQKRFESYKKILSQNSNRSIIFIFGDYQLLSEFSEYIKDVPHCVYSGNDSKTIRWEKWSEIHTHPTIVIATRIGIGLVPNSETLYVIDQPDHPGFKEDRRPKFTMEEMIKVHIDHGSSIFIGISYPSETVIYYLRDTIRFPQLGKAILHDNFNAILNRLDERTLIAIPRKGEWNGVYCDDCKEAIYCPTCESLLKLTNNRLICSLCTTEFNSCSRCGGTRIKGYGIGSKALAAKIRSLTNRDVAVIDASQQITTSQINSSNIVITTQKIFDYPVTPFTNIYCYGFDSLLDLPDKKQEQNILITLSKFMQLGSNKHLITTRPEHRIFQALSSGRVPFLVKEMIKESHPTYPPFTREVRIDFVKTPSKDTVNSFQEISKSNIKLINNSCLLYIQREKWPLFIEIIANDSTLTINPEPRNS